MMKFFILGISLFLSCFSALALSSMYLGHNEIITETPQSKESKGLIIIAPAKKYTMHKPLFSSLSKKLLKEGFIVVRFNWGFIKHSTEPSKNLVTEAHELNDIVSFFQKKFSKTKRETFLIAKSFGTRVFMKSQINRLGHVSLMTPNCDRQNTFDKTYGRLFQTHARINISLSIHDPYCQVGQIYDFISSHHNKITLYTTYGDHNFQTNHDSKQNQELVLRQLVNWVKQK